MTRALRASLARADPRDGANVGLALERYLPEVGSLDATRRGSQLAVVAGTPVPAVYRTAYQRWAAQLEHLPGIATRRVLARGRLIVGLGAETVHQTTVTLHRQYGVPMLPGSALKGLARRYVSSANGASPRQLEVLFGTSDSAAHISYFDAWYVPGSAPADRPLGLDVITVHHPEYYASHGRGDGWPGDFDDPTPLPLLSASGGYLVAVRGPDHEWAEFALRLLERALDEWGIGARTSSGYGRLRDPNGSAGAAT
jgi:CRISPR-associated protein Cmr6